MIKVKGNDAKTEVLQCVRLNLAVFEEKFQDKIENILENMFFF